MRALRPIVPWLLLTLAVSGCLGRQVESNDDVIVPDLMSSPLLLVDRGQTLLDCDGAQTAAVHAEFDCSAVTVYACAGIGEAVLEYADGAFERFDGPLAQIDTFAPSGKHEGKRVVAASIRLAGQPPAGAAAEPARFVAPADSCRALARANAR